MSEDGLGRIESSRVLDLSWEGLGQTLDERLVPSEVKAG